MNVLIINTYYFPHIVGGTEISIKILAEKLSKRGHNVFVYTLDGSTELDICSVEIINEVRIFRGYSEGVYKHIIHQKRKVKDIFFNHLHFYYNSKVEKDLVKIIDKNNIDVIHTNNMVSMSYAVWNIAKKKEIPVVHTLRDYWLMDPSTLPYGSSYIIRIFHENFFRKLSNRVSLYVTAPSYKTLDIFKKSGFFKNCNAKRIVNAIDISMETLERCIEKKIERQQKTIKYLYVGMLGKHKGINILLDAFSKIKDKDVSLIVCGDGPERNLVLDAAFKDDRIIYCGRLSQDELSVKYEEADVLIVPSLWEEPFGRIIIEGAQYALPTIGSTHGGIPEIINILNVGECCEVEQEGMLIASMRKYKDRNYIKSEIKKLTNCVNIFNSNTQCDNFIQIYSRLVRYRRN